MEIYGKDNKVLSYNNKCIKPKVNSETWVLNETDDFPPINIATTFISNANTFYGISGGGVLSYWNDLHGDSTLTVFNNLNRGWTDQAYRTITFLEPPTGELLTWLQANGVK